jgi:hypothetical protein
MFSGILRSVCFLSSGDLFMNGPYPVLCRPGSRSYRLDLFMLAINPGICLRVFFLFEADLILDRIEKGP